MGTGTSKANIVDVDDGDGSIEQPPHQDEVQQPAEVNTAAAAPAAGEEDSVGRHRHADVSTGGNPNDGVMATSQRKQRANDPPLLCLAEVGLDNGRARLSQCKPVPGSAADGTFRGSLLVPNVQVTSLHLWIRCSSSNETPLLMFGGQGKRKCYVLPTHLKTFGDPVHRKIPGCQLHAFRIELPVASFRIGVITLVSAAGAGDLRDGGPLASSPAPPTEASEPRWLIEVRGPGRRVVRETAPGVGKWADDDYDQFWGDVLAMMELEQELQAADALAFAMPGDRDADRFWGPYLRRCANLPGSDFKLFLQLATPTLPGSTQLLQQAAQATLNRESFDGGWSRETRNSQEAMNSIMTRWVESPKQAFLAVLLVRGLYLDSIDFALPNIGGNAKEVLDSATSVAESVRYGRTSKAMARWTKDVLAILRTATAGGEARGEEEFLLSFLEQNVRSSLAQSLAQDLWSDAWRQHVQSHMRINDPAILQLCSRYSRRPELGLLPYIHEKFGRHADRAAPRDVVNAFVAMPDLLTRQLLHKLRPLHDLRTLPLTDVVPLLRAAARAATPEQELVEELFRIVKEKALTSELLAAFATPHAGLSAAHADREQACVHAMCRRQFRLLIPPEYLPTVSRHYQPPRNHEWEQAEAALRTRGSHQQVLYRVDKGWWKAWENYSCNGGALPGPVTPSGSPDAVELPAANWFRASELFGCQKCVRALDTGRQREHRNIGVLGRQEVLNLVNCGAARPTDPAQAGAVHCHVLRCVTSPSLLELCPLIHKCTELGCQKLVPPELLALDRAVREWFENVLSGSCFLADVLTLKEVHGLQLYAVAQAYLEPGRPDMLDIQWRSVAELQMLLESTERIVSQYPKADGLPPPALQKLVHLQEEVFALTLKDVLPDSPTMPPDLQEVRRAEALVRRAGELGRAKIFVSFCRNSDQAKAIVASGLTWPISTSFGKLLHWWNELSRKCQPEMENDRNTEDLDEIVKVLGLGHAWEHGTSEEKGRLSAEVRTHLDTSGRLAEDITLYLIFTQKRIYIKSVLSFLQAVEQNFPNINCQGGVMRSLESFMKQTTLNMRELRGRRGAGDNRSDAAFAHIMSSWDEDRDAYAVSLTRHLNILKRSMEELHKQDFDSLFQMVAGLHGYEEEHEAMTALSDLKVATLALFEESFSQGAQDVLAWLLQPSREEAKRLSELIEHLEGYMTTCRQIAKEWTGDEYDKCMTRIRQALEAFHVELRRDHHDATSISIESMLFCQTSPEGGGTALSRRQAKAAQQPFQDFVDTEHRLFLYGQQKEEDRKDIESFHQLVDLVLKLSSARLSLVSRGFEAGATIRPADQQAQELIPLFTKHPTEAIDKALDRLHCETEQEQQRLQKELEIVERHGGTFFPTAQLSQLLKEIDAGTLSESFKALFNASVLVPPTKRFGGLRAERLVALDTQLRGGIMQRDVKLDMTPSVVTSLQPLLPELAPGLNTMLVHPSVDALYIVCSFFALHRQRLPRFYEMLFYSSNPNGKVADPVSLTDLEAFASRVRSPPSQDDLFVILGWELAPPNHKEKLRDSIPADGEQRVLALDQTGAGGRLGAITGRQLLELKEVDKVNLLRVKCAPIMKIIQQRFGNIVVVRSNRAGAGKSYWVQQHYPRASRVSLMHSFSRSRFVADVLQRGAAPTMWLNPTENCPRCAQLELFQLLLSGALFIAGASPVVVQPASSVDQNGFVLELFSTSDKEPHPWAFWSEAFRCHEIKRPSDELNTDLEEVQYVCKYLQEMGKGEGGLLFCKHERQPEFRASQQPQVLRQQAISLLEAHCPRCRGATTMHTSMAVVTAFLRYLRSQFSRLEASTVYFTNFSLAHMAEDSKQLRLVICKRLVRLAASMFEVVAFEVAENRTFELSKKWDEGHEPMVVINRQDEPTLSIFLAEGQPDTVKWAVYGVPTIQRGSDDSKSAQEMLDRVLPSPKIQVWLGEESVRARVVQHLPSALSNDKYLVAQEKLTLGDKVIPMGHVLRRKYMLPTGQQGYIASRDDVVHLPHGSTLTFVGADIAEADDGYALTMDNVLKMILIRSRVECGPVVLMGETGCGKTSLVKHLCIICGIQIHTLDVHGGIEMQDVEAFMSPVLRDARANPTVETWVFLDELNTSACIDIFAEMICEHRFMGSDLPTNLKVLGACNPYRTYQKDNSREKELVYQVLPLPQRLLNFIWDFGTLQPRERERYIGEMVRLHTPQCEHVGLVQLVVQAMTQLLKLEDQSCVSLRDARRTVRLAAWFLSDAWDAPARHAAMLAVVVSFYYRIDASRDGGKERKGLLRECDRLVAPESAEDVIEQYQETLARSIQIPDGIALNRALKANLFMMLTAVATGCPLFVVARPGQSKTLAMSLLRNPQKKNRDATAKPSLPRVSVWPYQCSEHTTARGLDDHFQFAEAQQAKRRTAGVKVVAFLDEVGLAEKNDKDRPLKVLHKRLENPTAAFIGLSNTRLDASKMNRALLLTHPDLQQHDMLHTAEVILSESSLAMRQGPDGWVQRFASSISGLFTDFLTVLKQYQNGRYEHLVDYRGFYNLTKSVARHIRQASEGDGAINTPEQVASTREMCDCILRNIGGVPYHEIENLLLEPIKRSNFQEAVWAWQRSPYLESAVRMANQSLRDKDSRHLMVIAPNEVLALDFLFDEGILERSRVTVFFGSCFEADVGSQLYIFQLLSKIRNAIEVGHQVVLVNLGRLHESLYEVLNQQYSYWNGKFSCRIAIGAESRQVPVHPNFRCIVVMKTEVVHPPGEPQGRHVGSTTELRFLSALLSRFEKVVVSNDAMVPQGLRQSMPGLQAWLEGVTKVTPIPGAGRDIVSLLLNKRCQGSSAEVAKQQVQEGLVEMMPPGMLLYAGGKLGPEGQKRWTEQRAWSFVELLRGELRDSNGRRLQLLVRTFDENADLKPLKAAMHPMLVEEMRLSDMPTHMALEQELRKLARAAKTLPGTQFVLLMDCDEAMKSELLQHTHQVISETLLGDEDVGPRCVALVFLLRQGILRREDKESKAAVPTLDFGHEWKALWVDNLSSSEAYLRPDHFLSKPQEMLAYEGLLLASLEPLQHSFPVAYKGEVPASRQTQQNVKSVLKRTLNRLRSDKPFRDLILASVCDQLRDEPGMKSWVALLTRDHPFGVHEPLLWAAQSALAAHVQEAFLHTWAELDQDANLDLYEFGDEAMKQAWLLLGRTFMKGLRERRRRGRDQLVLHCDCQELAASCGCPFARRLLKRLKDLRPQLLCFMGPEDGAERVENKDARWKRAYYWNKERLREFLGLDFPVGYEDFDIKPLLGQIARAFQRKLGFNAPLLPLVRHWIGHEVNPPGSVLQATMWILAAVEALDHALEHVGGVQGAAALLTTSGSSTAESWDGQHSEDSMTLDEALGNLHALACDSLKGRALQGRFVTHRDLAQLTGQLAPSAAEVDTGLRADLLAYADLGLRLRRVAANDAETRELLKGFAGTLGFGRRATAEELLAVARYLAEKLPALRGPLRQCLADFGAGQIHDRMKKAGSSAFSLELLQCSCVLANVCEFPTLVALKLLENLLRPEHADGVVTLTLPASQGESFVLASTLVLFFEDTLARSPEAASAWEGVRNPRSMLFNAITVALLRFHCREVEKSVKRMLEKRTPVASGHKESVHSFIAVLFRLPQEKQELVKRWAVRRLGQKFGAETLSSSALMLPGGTHLLAPELIAFTEQSDADEQFARLEGLARLPEILGHFRSIVEMPALKADGVKRLRQFSPLELCAAAFVLSYGAKPATVRNSEALGKDLGLQDHAAKLFSDLLIPGSQLSELLKTMDADLRRVVFLCIAGAAVAGGMAKEFLQAPGSFHSQYIWGLAHNRYYDVVHDLNAHVQYGPQFRNPGGYASGGPIYECPDGHPYWVQACGRPMEENKCRLCGKTIGGRDHNPAPGNRAVARGELQTPKPGFCEVLTAVGTPQLTSPRAFLSLHIWTHAVLMASLALDVRGSKASAETLLPVRRKSAKDMQSIVMGCFMQLCHECGDGGREGLTESLLVLFSDQPRLQRHWSSARPSTPQQCDDIERSWQQLASASEGQRLGQLPGARLVQPPTATSARGAEEGDPLVANLSLPSVEELRGASKYSVRLLPEAAETACPTFERFVSSQHELVFCRNLPHLVRIPQLVIRHYSNRVTQVELLGKPLEDVLGEHWRKEWKAFADAWNEVREQLLRVECVRLDNPPERMEPNPQEEQQPNVDMFIDWSQGYGLMLWELVKKLCEYQNKFLVDTKLEAQQVDILDFQHHCTIQDVGFVDKALICATSHRDGVVRYQAQALEAETLSAVAQLCRIDCQKPEMKYLETPMDEWRDAEMLPKRVPQERCEENVREAFTTFAAESQQERPAAELHEGRHATPIEALLRLCEQCLRVLLQIGTQDRDTRLVDFARSTAGLRQRERALLGYLPIEFHEVKLMHLCDFWELIFDLYEPNYAVITHVAYCDDLLQKDRDALLLCLSRWSDGELRDLQRWLKMLATQKLLDESILKDSPLAHSLYPMSGDDNRLFDPEYFPQALNLRYAVAALRPIRMRRGLEPLPDNFQERGPTAVQRPPQATMTGVQPGDRPENATLGAKRPCSCCPPRPGSTSGLP